MKFNYSDRMANLNGTATREIFKLLSRPEIVSFAGGLPTNDTLPVAQVDEITRELLASPDAKKVLQYGTTEGFVEFRELLIEYIKGVGITNQTLDNILVVSGGQQGIDLVCKAMLNKNDVVLVEDPTYLAVLQILNSYEAKAQGVKTTKDGLDIADLEEKIKKHNPKFLYCVPTFSNPTGKTYSVENRKAILNLAQKYNMLVVEDDPYSKLRFSGTPVNSLKSFDTTGNVLYVTSFSKIIAPGLRTGVVCGDKDLIRKMAICKQGTDLHTSNLSQLIAKKYLEKGYLVPNIEKSLPIYKERKDAMFDAIKKYMPKEFEYTNPDGGLFIWGEFKADLDTKELLPRAVENNVAYIQGSVFYADGGGKNTIRLNFSNESLQRIESGVKALGNLYTTVIQELSKR